MIFKIEKAAELALKAEKAAEEFNLQIAAATSLAQRDGVSDAQIVRVLVLIGQVKAINLRGSAAVDVLRKYARDFAIIADRIEALPAQSTEQVSEQSSR